jgi:hypothetical protein
LQAIVEAAWQVPFPSQVRPEVKVELPVGQEGAAQDVPPAYLRQAPLPSQKPSVPQVVFPWSWQVACGSAVPLGTLLQVPGAVVSAQDWQAPVQAVAQQTDCEQKLDEHSAAVTQACPSGLSPQEPLMQTAGEAQSEFAVQEFLQMFVPHWYGKQGAALGVTHLPAPSQVDVPVKVEVPPGQVEPRQLVPCT